MSHETSKKLVLIKTLYYRNRNQDGTYLGNKVEYKTTPNTASASSIIRLTDKSYNPIDNGFINFTTILIPADNSLSGITNQTFQESFILKTKCGFVSANQNYFDYSSSTTTSIDKVDYPVTAGSGDLKNAYLVRIEYDNDGTKFSKGVKFARKVSVFACE